MTPARAGALLGLLVATGGLYGAANSTAFGYTRLELSTLHWTDETAVRSAIAVPLGVNLFTLRAGPIEERIRLIPSVAAVRVELGLPGTIAVRVTERQPIIVWQAGETRFLVDRSGDIFGTLPADASTEIPIVQDLRTGSAAGLVVGSALDPVDLDAATRLASLVPADVGSRATSLAVAITDENGFVVGSVPADWTAIFGLYTPTVRTTDLIPGQVRLLRSLLSGREGTVAQVILADATEGTYIPKEGSPVPASPLPASPSPGASGTP